jgi:hypothetical protein
MWEEIHPTKTGSAHDDGMVQFPKALIRLIHWFSLVVRLRWAS